jgi:serine/threonine protein kinase
MSELNSDDVTEEQTAGPAPRNCSSHRELPLRIGRYRIERVLGKGGFGTVYLANDEQLKRLVAVKVPHGNLITKSEDADAYRAEARTVANLDHPSIVPVYDVGSTEEFPCYVVSKYISGTDLATKLKQERTTYREAARLVSAVADALHYAHKQGVVHRDVKPGNILIDNEGKPYIVDFGVALREENIGKGPKYAGTLAYMSPEQARCEGHRVDGRSDIFSLGVVLYELLAGRRPFRGDTHVELFEQVTSLEAKPLRQYDEKLPKELQRICYKAMAKRASERYASAHDFAEDLRLFLAEQTVIQSGTSTGDAIWVTADTPASKGTSTSVGSRNALSTALNQGESDGPLVKIVPKGLRSFDSHDADFFLELLPGPRDREGLPDSLRFWKTRIEEMDPDSTFSVGLIYGPSGCGKSSLVRAGLLPRLSEDIIPIYIEATPEETEIRLLHGLRKRCPAMPDSIGLKDTLAVLRRGQGIRPGKKVLIVLDQFEQWLHANKEENSDLVQALRQCDGCRVQCIVIVRDDFWMASTRFMRDLEVRIVESLNSAAVDLFPIRHAEKVLAAFGRAFGTLPGNLNALNKEQKAFLTQSVAGMAEDGKVICVRLALFAEMLKAKPWTPTTLKEVGGTKGVGVTFLEETFSGATSPPEHRYHQRAARAVLKALLPNSGTGIKGTMRSYGELLEASGYSNRPQDFDELICILDNQVRLITPTDPQGMDADREPVSQPQAERKHFQLAHDYLVPSLLDWLTRKQRETRKGRAELKLEELAAEWKAKRENKQLPTVIEWLGIRMFTEAKRWTDTQRSMMGKAARVHGTLWGGLLLALVLLGMGIQQWASAERWKNLKEQTRVAAESLQNNLGPTVAVNLKELGKLPPELVLPELRTRFSSSTNPSHKLSLAFALAGYGEQDAGYLVSRIDDIAEADARNYVTALKANSTRALAALRAEAFKCGDKPLWRSKIRLAIVACALGDMELALDVCTFDNRPDPEQRTLFIHEFPKWDVDLKVVLEAVRNCQSPALRSGICLAAGQVPVERVVDADKESWKSVVSEWFLVCSDTSTHSAAGWLLRRWMLPIPQIPQAHEITLHRDWFVNSVGSTMLRIHSEDQGEFWVCDREVTRGQFEQFMNDSDYASTKKPENWMGVDAAISPTSDHPAQRVNWYDAVLYCNWLSLREGLQPSYEQRAIRESVVGEEHDAWRQIPGASGYRLLNEAEWEYVSRAGTSTEYSSGDDEWLLADYCQMYPSKQAALCGAKLPNAWGLHDVHGNVWELCWNTDDVGSSLVYRGGGWDNDPARCKVEHRSTAVSTIPASNGGFRIALIPSGATSFAVQSQSEDL